MRSDYEREQGLWIHSHSHSSKSEFQNARYGHRGKENLSKYKWSMFLGANYCSRPPTAVLPKWHRCFSMPKLWSRGRCCSGISTTYMEHWIVLFLSLPHELDQAAFKLNIHITGTHFFVYSKHCTWSLYRYYCIKSLMNHKNDYISKCNSL